MASCDLGYRDERFENDVDENFHCPICMNVLKDPVMCQRNQHCFCTPCISRHLQNSNACPSCREELSVETLSQAPRVLTNYLSTLKIRCDYFERGCVGFHQLGDLKSHVEGCGFSPVLCSNDGCLAEINKRDRRHHEAEVCEFRKLKCHDCAALRREMDEIKDKLNDIEGIVKENFSELNDIEGIKSIKEDLNEIPGLIRGIKEEIMKDTRTMMAEMKDEIKQIRIQYCEGASQCNTVNNAKGDIVIAGGFAAHQYNVTNSVEMFTWSTMSWIPSNPMRQGRYGACSFVHKNSLFVAGGCSDTLGTDTIERMNITQNSEQWTTFPAKLPTNNKNFKAVVYKDRLIITGGYNYDGGSLSRNFLASIYDVSLVPPYAGKLLTTMPQPRVCHGAELINDNIFVVGGRTSFNNKDNLDSVLMYDINSNQCKEMAPLPFALSNMATVSKGDDVFVIGGKDKNDKVLNTVVKYDTNTGKSELLPEMKYCRAACSAVITGNVIVVMGGRGEHRNRLGSVECFEFDCNKWKELPPMKVSRCDATAVVKPVNFT